VIHTLGLSEDTLLDTSAECAVEQGVEQSIVGDLVVGLHVLLEGGTAGD
jgi:hypothetical protein